ncbi:MAG: signal peptidase II [Clostridia bacterium]|nr:signal peptidase II [Clostridia bacterium]
MTITITLVMVALLVGLDQLIKVLVIANVKPVAAVPFIDGIIQFRYVENTGAAFSILSEKTWLLSIITGVMILIGLLYLFLGKADNKLQYVSIVLVISGGLGNLIDRIFRGFVVDFIEYLFMEYAVFNFADILVTVGAVLLVVSVLFVKDKEQGEKVE